MKFRRLMALTIPFLLSILAFQNCSKSSQDLHFTNEASKSSVSGDNGNHYDGKVFILIGDLCTDGSQVRSKIKLSSSVSARLLRENCSDLTTPTNLTADDFKLNAMNTNVLTYKSQTFVADLIGAGFGIAPKLTITVDPKAYGAKGDGITDNTAAFTAALAAGDILVSAGTYLINGTIKVPTGRNIQCANLTDVKIVNSVTAKSGIATFQFWSKGGSISNCHMSGTDVFNPNGSATFDVNAEFNFLVSVVDYYGGPVGNVSIVNNIFENCHGNSCVTIYGGKNNIDNTVVSYNTFRNCGYHALVVDGATNTLASQNHLTDCSLSVQNDTLDQANFNNIFEYNYLTVTHGNAVGAPYLTGGGNGTFAGDYSTNKVRNNTVVGNGTAGSINIWTAAVNPAQYSENSCTSGCGMH